MASWGRGNPRENLLHTRLLSPEKEEASHLTKTTATVLKVVLTSAGHILFPQLNTVQEGTHHPSSSPPETPLAETGCEVSVYEPRKAPQFMLHFI